MAASETLRAREVYRYYQPRSSTESLDLPEPQVAADDNENQRQKTNFDTQQSFSDTALTAFTQLIALRLEAQRAIVSLIDHKNEYFLAESTSTLSLIGDDGPTQNAWLSISGARVPRESSLCEQTLCLTPNEDSKAGTVSAYLVPDLRLHDQMRDLNCVKGSPYLRFYFGVALTNKEGVNIGCVYVVDDRPRHDVSTEQAQFLSRMAATVMDHLENIRAKEDAVRVTRMSQALHAFIEGDGTMDGDWQRLKKYNLPSGTGVGYHWESKPKNINPGHVIATKGPTRLLRNIASSTGSDFSMNTGQSPLQHSEGSTVNQRNLNHSPWNSSTDVFKVPALKSVFEVVEDAAIMLEGIRDSEFTSDGFTNLLRRTFSRASNLIREGMEVDGAVFFDAPFKFYQGRSTLESDPRMEAGHHTYPSSGSEDEEDDQDGRDDHRRRPGPRPQAYPSKRPESKQPRRPEPLEADIDDTSTVHSEVLGFSTAESSSLSGDILKTKPTFTAIDQGLLTSLVRRYPLGELFVFDESDLESGASTSPTFLSPVTATTRRTRKIAQKSAEILQLQSAFPGARQIFFVPLYDSTSGCFLGSFAWSNSASRMFSIENHLSYLVAFGHSVMTEVSRLNTLSADRAKGDFINNVSHELRSPLHGILASVEFIADTTLDGFQKNLVNTIDNCGRTLLDTIEHVLDFTKIKKFGQTSTQPMGIVTDLDVSAVIEEVLEGVYAGFEYNGLSSNGLADTTIAGNRHASRPSNERLGDVPSHSSSEPVVVILDIDFREQWKFPTVPGTWRRLTMNIFSNALKYTSEGYIKIKLEARSISPLNSDVKNDGIERTLVTLTMTDSGHGMSASFLENNLFAPFSQEDVTKPGTGLGMSLVKQIVDLAGGKIDVKSQKNKGTTIVVSLPIEDCVHDMSGKAASELDEEAIEAVRRRASGRKVTIRGFETDPHASDLSREAVAALKASLEMYITDWFKLIIVTDDEDADIVVCDESVLVNTTVAENKFCALLVLCSNSARRDIYATQLKTGQTVEFVSKPCGPHRLAKALLNCFNTEDARGPRPHVDLSSDDSLSEHKLSLNTDSSSQPTPKQTFYPLHPVLASDAVESTELLTSRSLDRDEAGRLMISPVFSSDNVLSDHSISETSDLDETPRVVSRPKMLLVEDNPVNMMLLSTFVRKNNWEFEMATNGLLAVQAFERRPEGFDVIFMDVSMPVMTGYEATRLIRATEKRRRSLYARQQRKSGSSHGSFLSPPSPSFPFNIPYHSQEHSSASSQRHSSNSTSPSAFSPAELDVLLTQQAGLVPKPNRPSLIIALTGFSSEKDQEIAHEAGVDVFMTKPVKFRQLRTVLDGWMEREEDAVEDAEDVPVAGHNAGILAGLRAGRKAQGEQQ